MKTYRYAMTMMAGLLAHASCAAGQATDNPGDAPRETEGQECPDGQKMCDEVCVSIDDPAYGCGTTCGLACQVAGATATCVGGTCAIETCQDGYGDCDGVATNGCETLITEDGDHCGACDLSCEAVGGERACEQGVCGPITCFEGVADCDLDAANGCEVDLGSDSTNCGMCGRTCDGAACTDGLCAPIELDAEGGSLVHVGGGHVYYTVGLGEVRRVQVAGGPTEVVVNGDMNVNALAVSGGDLYFTDFVTSSLMRVPTDGSAPPVTLLDYPHTPTANLQLDATHAYFLTVNLTPGIHRVPLNGGTSEYVVPNGGAFTLLGDSIYGYVGAGLSQVAKTGGPATLLDAGGSESSFIEHNGDQVLWSRDQVGNAPAGLAMWDITASTGQLLLSLGTAPDSFAVDDEAVYFIQPAGTAVDKPTLRKASLATGSASTMLALPAGSGTGAQRVDLDDTHVFINTGTSILRVPK